MSTDLAAAHLLALDRMRDGAPAAFYNLGNGRPTSVRDVIAAVEGVVGSPVPHTVVPRREGDPDALFASSERARPQLGWSPRFEDIDIIVDTALRWRQSRPRGYDDRTAG